METITKKSFIDHACNLGVFFSGVYRQKDLDIIEEKINTLDHTEKPRIVCKKTSAGFFRDGSEYRHETGTIYKADKKAFYVFLDYGDLLIYIK